VSSALQILMRGPYARAMLTNFLFFLALNGFLLLPLYVKRLGGSEADVGLVQSMFSVAGILCQPLIGLWVDRLGRRLFMLLGVGLLALSSAAFIVGVSIPVAAALRALHGIAFSLFFVANYVHIVDLVPVERRGWALGIFGLSGLVSTAVAPLIGEVVIRRLGFGWSFAVSSLVAAVALVLVLRSRDVRPPVMGAGPGVEAFRVGLQELLRIHMALGFFFGLGTGTLFTFLPTFAEHMGVTGLGLFYTGYSASAMAVRVFGGNLIDTHGRRAVIVPSMFVQTAAVAVLALLALLLGPTVDVPVLPFLLFAGVMAGSAHGFLYPALSALVVDVTPEARRSSAVGIFSSVCLVGNALGAMTFGYVAHGLGYGVMWTGLGLLLALGILTSLRLRPLVPAGEGKQHLQPAHVDRRRHG